MFYSFGFFENDQENEKVLSNFYNALKPWGRFLMHTDVNIPRILQNKYKVDEMRTLADWKKLRIIDNYNPKTKRIEWSRTIIDSDWNQEQKKYSVRVYTKEEFTAMCLKIGFTKVETFSDWNWNIYSESAEDMIIIATK
jgi:hypothetical protein